jgi:uncharacterized membrane protein YfcA
LRGTVQWHIVGRLCMGALPAALVATLALQYFGPLGAAIGQVIRYSIAVSVLLTVVAILFRARMLAWVARQPERQLQGRALAAATIASGAVLGPGHGILDRRRRHRRDPAGDAVSEAGPAEVAGTDIAYAVPLTAIAAAGHWWLGSIDWCCC